MPVKNNSLDKIALITIMFLLLATGLPFIIQPANAASVPILSHSSYISSIGSYWIVGEVQNLDTYPVRYIKIRATYYDNNDAIITDDFGYADLHIILPNQKSPFDILLFDKNQSSRVDHYTLEVEPYDYTSTLPLNLKVVSSNGSFDSTGSVHITGEVENAESINATNPHVWATLYDSNGKVVAVGDDGYMQPAFLFGIEAFIGKYNQTAGQKESFSIYIDPEEGGSLAKSYTLVTSSDLDVNSISNSAPTNPTSFDQPATGIKYLRSQHETSRGR